MNREFVYLIIIQASSFAMPWLLTIYYSQVHGLKAAGELSFVLAVVSPLVIILSNPTRNYLLINRGFDLRSALHARIYLLLAGVGVSVLIGYLNEGILIFVFLFILKESELLFDLPLALYIGENKPNKIKSLAVLKWGGVFMSGFLLLFFSVDIGYIYAACSVYFVFVVNFFLRGGGNPDSSDRAIFYIKKSLPLSFCALVASVQFNAPRYVIADTEEKSILAVYAMTSYILLPVIVLINTYWQSKLPEIASVINKTYAKNIYLCAKMLITTIAISLLIQLMQSPFLIEVFWSLHGKEVIDNDSLLSVYRWVIATCFAPILYSVSNYLLMAAKMNNALLVLSFFSLISTWVFCKYFYVAYGFLGVIFGYAIGCLIHVFGVLAILFSQKINTGISS